MLFKVCLKLAGKQLPVNRSQAAHGQMTMQISLLNPAEACYNIAMVRRGEMDGDGCRRFAGYFRGIFRAFSGILRMEE